MPHTTSVPREQPWRTTAFVAAGIAALELLLLVTLVLVLVGTPLSGGEEPARHALSKPAAGRTTDPLARLTREETSVIVLNGNGAPGAASEKADLVQTKGYMIAGTANAPRSDFARSLVMYRAGYAREAERLARDFHVARVAPLDGLRPAQLQGAHLALIVGAR
ncbi:MAG: LytR C-terminal domain-containing protein [Thermoleophilia bacterium]|nr:LytR C-terminal domain-containing protein [Thermoleophilia bacterium]